METTVVVGLVIGLLSLLLVLDGAACLVHVENFCFASRSFHLIAVVMGSVMVVPLLVCLASVWSDLRVNTQKEAVRLLISPEHDREGDNVVPGRVRTYLFVSRLYSAWGDRMWQFAVPILFMEIFVDTLLPSACFALLTNLVCIFTIPALGEFIDQTNRWRVMRLAIVLENVSIVITCVVLGIVLVVTDADGIHKPVMTWQLFGLFVVIQLFGGVGQVLNDTQTLAIEKDWVVVLAADDVHALSSLNTWIRRIDLACSILAPMAFGVIMDCAGENPTTRAIIGATSVGIWNIVSLPLEFVMTKEMYRLCPQLAVKTNTIEDARSDPDSENGAGSSGTIRKYLNMWKVFSHHAVFLVSFSFCTLYMTVLDGEALATAYLKWRGLPGSVIGASRGFAALVGFVGTFVFPLLLQHLRLVERVAVVTVWCFWLHLAPIALAFLVSGSSTASDYVMLVGIGLSRAWLWSCDLAETQIMQEWVEPQRRGMINSMQTATSQVFFILIQVAGMVCHDPAHFDRLVFLSVFMVGLAAIGFSSWYCKFGVRREGYLLAHRIRHHHHPKEPSTRQEL